MLLQCVLNNAHNYFVFIGHLLVVNLSIVTVLGSRVQTVRKCYRVTKVFVIF